MFKDPFENSPFRQALNGALKEIERIASMHRKLVASYQPALDFLAQRLQMEPEAVKRLASLGWYLPFDFDGEISQLTAAGWLIDKIDEGKESEVDNDLIRRFDEQERSIQEALIKHYPERKNQIMAAIEAHNTKVYYLSVPVFFVLIDGISKEVIGNLLFYDTHKARKWARSRQSEFAFPNLLEPLISQESIAWTGKKRDVPIGLNRHDVLHGLSTDYGDNPLNSYKTLSLLNYIGLTLREIKYRK